MIEAAYPMWTIHPQLQNGELFESWIVRLSAENGVPVNTVVEQLGLGNIFGSVDNISSTVVQKLGLATGMPTQIILESHLGWYEDQKGLAFTTPFTSFGRNKTASAREFRVCPECLAEQSKPHILLTWALEITYFCRNHYQPLIDSCPECQRPFSFDSRPGQSFLPEKCHHCGTSLKYRRRNHGIDFRHVVEFQSFLMNLKCLERVTFRECRIISGQTFVQIVQRILGCLANVPNQQTFLKKLPSPFQNEIDLLDDRLSESHRRVNAFLICAWIVTDPCTRIPILQNYTRKHVEYAMAIKIIAMLNRTLEVLQIGKRSGL